MAFQLIHRTIDMQSKSFVLMIAENPIAYADLIRMNCGERRIRRVHVYDQLPLEGVVTITVTAIIIPLMKPRIGYFRLEFNNNIHTCL